MKDRTAAKNREKNLTFSHPEAPQRRAPRTDRSPDRAIEPEIRHDCRRRSRTSPDRLAILDSIPGVSNITAFALAHRHAGTRQLSITARPPRSPASRPSPGSPGNGPVAPSFAVVAPTSARRSTCRPRRHPLQSRPEGQIRSPHRRRKTRQEVAITAIMRKLIVLANALLKDQSKMDAKNLP